MPVIRCLKRKSAALENEYGAQRFQNEARSPVHSQFAPGHLPVIGF